MVGKYILWGSSGHAKVLADLIHEQKGEVIALFDNSSSAISVVKGVKLWHGEEGFNLWKSTQSSVTDVTALVAIGGARGEERHLISNKLRKAGLNIISVIHKKAYVAPTARLGLGCQVLANSTVASGVRIGDACIINHNASIDHECHLGIGVHVSPGATICGCAQVNDYAMIGAGAIILPRLVVGKNAIIGAGAVVTRHIENGETVVGNPAKCLNKNF
jgi:sugar O-acyltransferase (sialic acid O-acetyltransferase NeuD family)